MTPVASIETITSRLTEVSERMRANSFIDACRREHEHTIEDFSGHIERVCGALGRHVANTAKAEGGLVVEAKRSPTSSETAQIDHILEAAQIRNWQRDMLGGGYARRYSEAYDEFYNTLTDFGYSATKRVQIAERCLAEGGRRLGLLDLRQGTREALFNVLERTHALGLSPRETARYIEEFVPAGRFVNAGPKYRATMIARTEINHAWRFASIEQYRNMGIGRVIMYDGDSDPQCSSRNGNVVSVDEAAFEMFVTHPNCVLAFAPAPPGF